MNRILSTICGLLYCLQVTAQSNQNYNSSFTELSNEAQSMFHIKYDSIERAEKMYGRWYNFWKKRAAFGYSNKDSILAVPSLAFDFTFSNFNNGCLGNGYKGNWKYIGPFYDDYGEHKDKAGRVTALWVSPTDTNYILAGAGLGGIWKTKDGGKNWINITDGGNFSNMPGTIGITGIQVHPVYPDIIYAATGTARGYATHWNGEYTLGLIVSTDGGLTWNPDYNFRTVTETLETMGWSNEYYRILKIKYLPSGALLALTSNQVLIKKTFSSSWEDITPAHFRTIYETEAAAGIYQDARLKFLDFEEANTSANSFNVVFASTRFNSLLASDQFLYYYNYSTNSWSTPRTLLFSGISSTARGGILDLGVTASDSLVFMLSNRQVYKSHYLTGSAYLKRNSSARPDTWGVFPSKSNEQKAYYLNVYGADAFISRTENGGQSDMFGFGTTHADGRCMVYYYDGGETSGINDILFVGTDGGVAKKSAGNVNFHSISGKGLNIGTFYGLSSSPRNDGFALAGAQDNGTQAYIRKHATTPWSKVWTMDGLLPAFSKNGENYAYSQHQGHFNPATKFNYNTFTTAGYESVAPIDNWLNFGSDRHWMRPVKFNDHNMLQSACFFVNTKPMSGGSWDYQFGQIGLNTGDPKRFYNLSITTDSINWHSVRDRKRVADFELPEDDPKIAYVAYEDIVWDNTYISNDSLTNLFRSKNANQFQISGTFPDWQNINTGNHYLPITDVEVDHNRPNRIWVSYGGTLGGDIQIPSSYRTSKVFYSEDYGDNFTDISRGLPPMPIMKLEHVPGTEHVVFAATDMGVYKWNNDQKRWECFNNGMPRCIVTDIEYLACSGKLRVSTYGRGIWESPAHENKFSFRPDPTKIITTNTVWNSSKTLNGSLLVKSGNTLTISGSGTSIYMPYNGMIMIEKGAALVIDGAVITNDCDSSRWYGIQLKGDISSAPTAGNMGTLIMKNGASVQNAYVGVSDYFLSDLQGGGIIKAENSSFINCFKAVALNYYPNYDRSDNCFFKKVNFITKDNSPFYASMFFTQPTLFTIWNERGVLIDSCLFKDERTDESVKLSTAFGTLDADYKITNSRFEGLNKAISSDYAMTGGFLPAPKIYKNSFNNVRENVTLYSVNPTVFQNSFNDLKAEFPPEFSEKRKAWAIYNEGPFGARIDENTITGGSIDMEYYKRLKLGIILNATNSPGFELNTYVMNNSLKYLERGLQTEKMNYTFRFNCNSLQKNRYGISVNPVTGWETMSYISAQNGTCGTGTLDTRPNNSFIDNEKDIASWMTHPGRYLDYHVNPASMSAFTPLTLEGGVNLISCTGIAADNYNYYCQLRPMTATWSVSLLNQTKISYGTSKQLGDIDREQYYYLELLDGYTALSDTNGIKTFLLSDGKPISKLFLANLYLAENNFTALNNVIANISQNQSENYAIGQYYTILKNVKQSNRRFFELTNQEKLTLESIAAGDYIISKAAKAYLEWFYGLIWIHNPEDLPVNSQLLLYPEQAVTALGDATPNPAMNKVSIPVDIKTSDLHKNTVLKLFNSNGVLLKTVELKEANNLILLDLSEYVSGTYIYSLTIDGKTIKSKKLIKL